MTDPAQPASEKWIDVSAHTAALGLASYKLEELARQLSLAQTENAGHIRIEDELKSDLAQAQERCAELEKALTRIEEWSSFPPAESNGEPCSYGVAYGSNGERDYMRGIAKIALKARPKP